MKPKRFVDEDALEIVRKQYCVSCGKGDVHPHHLITRGAGGGDTLDNLVPLCQEHHAMLHQIGIVRFCGRYYAMREWLKANGKMWVLERAARKIGEDHGNGD